MDHRRSLAPLSVVFPALLSVVAGCGELREDGDYMCLVPVDCDPEEVDVTCLEGDYPADTPLTIRVWAEAAAVEVVRERCWAEITGDFELTVHSRWRERDTQDNLALTPWDCEAPPLAAGNWTIVFGDEQIRLRVPGEQVPVACTSRPEW